MLSLTETLDEEEAAENSDEEEAVKLDLCHLLQNPK